MGYSAYITSSNRRQRARMKAFSNFAPLLALYERGIWSDFVSSIVDGEDISYCDHRSGVGVNYHGAYDEAHTAIHWLAIRFGLAYYWYDGTEKNPVKPERVIINTEWYPKKGKRDEFDKEELRNFKRYWRKHNKKLCQLVRHLDRVWRLFLESERVPAKPKMFRLELQKGKVSLRGTGTPTKGDLLGVSESIMHREAGKFIQEQFGLDIQTLSTASWPGKNKPFSCYSITKY